MSTKNDQAAAPAVATKQPPVKVKSLDCITALANVIPSQCTVVISDDKTDAVVGIAYTEDDKGTVGTLAVSMNLLDAAYVGIVKLWPMMKETKDEVRLTQATLRNEARAKASEDRKVQLQVEKDKRAEERAAAKTKHDEELLAAKTKRDEDRAAKAKEKSDALAKKKADREAAIAQKKLDKEAADKAKKEADTAKAAAAATRNVTPAGNLTKGAQTAVHAAGAAKPAAKPVSASTKAVRAIQGGARMVPAKAK